MKEAEIKFEREGREGIIAVGTYLIDAMRRMGIRLDGTCLPAQKLHYCGVKVASGSEHLTEQTGAENEFFASNAHGAGERLACQTKIKSAGEVVIMTKQKKNKETEAEVKDHSEEYRKEFEELPLEKKIASLVRLEAIALGETVSFVINSPFKVFEKAMDVLAEFGLKLEKDAKESVRPDEHKEKQTENEKTNGSSAEGKAASTDEPAK